MAYFLKQNEDQNNQNQQPQNVGGNIYSTSGSEVNSQVENNSNSSNSSNSNNSNSSGNWVNLNSYLEANQNKAGKYVSNLMNPYSQQQPGYETKLNESKDNYSNAIKTNSLNTQEGQKVANSYYADSNSISQNDWNRARETEQGYSGKPNEYQNTGDDYGYSGLKKQADQFKEISDNLNNDVYLQSLMDKNLSQGGKTLNSFLMGATNTGRNALSNYKQTFGDLWNLLENSTNDLNKQRAEQEKIATENQANWLNSKQAAKKAQEQAIRNSYDSQKAVADNNRVQGVGAINRTMNLSNNDTPITISIANNPYQEGSAFFQLQNELDEIEARDQALSSGIRGNGSRTDTSFDFGGYGRGADNQRNVDLQIQRANTVLSDLSDLLFNKSTTDFQRGLISNLNENQLERVKERDRNNVIDLLSDRNAGTEAGFRARQLLQQTIQGDINYNDGLQQIANILLNSPLY